MKKTIGFLVVAIRMVSCLPLTAYAAEDSKMVPVVVKVPEGWDAPNLWAWADDGTNVFAAWFGEPLLQTGWPVLRPYR